MAYSWAIEDYDRFRAKSWPAATSDHDGPDNAKIRHGLAKGNEDMPDDNTAAAAPAVMPSLPDGDPCLHEGLVGRRTPAVEEAFELLKLDEETQLGDFRRIIHMINNECDPYLLRKSAQWDEVKGNGMVESANDKRKRAAEIERLMFGGENTSL